MTSPPVNLNPHVDHLEMPLEYSFCTNCGSTYKTYESYPVEMLSSNTSYSDAQRTLFRASVGDIQTEISRLMEEMNRLHTVMDSLNHSLTEYQALASPIRTVPSEILSEIFVWANDTVVSVHSAPWILSRICSRWRSVVLATPLLWSSVHVDENHTSQNIIELLQFWLSHSGSLPLHIDLRWKIRDLLMREAPPLMDGRRSTTDIIILYSHRWSDVTFTLPAAEYSKLATVRGHLPMLQVLGLEVYGELVAPCNAFEFAPILQNVTLISDIQTSQCPLPWHQLRCFEGKMSPIVECLDILQLCPGLEECKMSSLESEALASLAPLNPILHSHMQTMNLTLDLQSHICLLAYLTCPSLRNLEIRLNLDKMPDADDDDLPPSNYPSSFLARSKCNLSRLCLSSITLSGTELITCLCELPFLVRTFDRLGARYMNWVHEPVHGPVAPASGTFPKAAS